jgi:dUTPase
MNLLIKNTPGLSLPSQAHPGEDACYDVIAATPPNIIGDKFDRMDGLALWRRIHYVEYGTNLFVCPLAGQDKAITQLNLPKGKSPLAVKDFVWTEKPIDYHLHAYPRSSISKYNLSLANSVGTIDVGYRGEIKVRFKYLFQPEDLIMVDEAGGRRSYGIVNVDAIYGMGDKICQIEPCENKTIEFKLVDVLPPSARVQGGFGSSGK